MINTILVDTNTREIVSKDYDFLGVSGENEIETLEFKMTDFIDGEAILEIQKDENKNYITLDKGQDSYSIKVKNSLISDCRELILQLHITNSSEEIFKSQIFRMEVYRSIHATEEIPEEYPEWIDTANAKIALIDTKVEEINALETNLEASESTREANESNRQSNETTRQANESTRESNEAVRKSQESSRAKAETERESYITELKKEVSEGVFNGKDAKINGVNTLTLQATDNISATQTGGVLKIKGVTTLSKFINDMGYIDKDVNNLTNYELKSNTGSSLDMTIDNTTYIMTMTLKNSAGETLSEKQVDLPIESMIINVSYNESTKTLTFTLQNGNVINVPLSDLVSGLVTTTELNTKLADYYKASEVDTKLKDYAKSTDIPTKTSELTNDSDYTTKTYVDDLVGNIDTVLETLTTGSGV